MNLKMYGWIAVAAGIVLVIIGVAHANHSTQLLVGLGVVAAVCGYELARGKIQP